MRIRTYLNGVATGDENIVPEVLSLDLIGGAGKSLVTITPTMPFDEIQLDMGGLVDALVELDVYGAFVQSDTDGDGIPDCLDKSPCGLQLTVDAYSVCGTNHAEVIMEGGEDGATYTLWDGNNEHTFVDGVASFDIDPGHYNCTIRENGQDVYYDVMLDVHADYTMWTGAVSTEWSDWDNWTHGVPGECTNVLIPSTDSLITTNGIHYPILEAGKALYVCNGIYLKPGAEVINQQLLDYNKAWVATNILPEKSNMISVPLKETYSGDFFVYKTSGNEETLLQDYKNPLLGDTLVGNVNRLVPSITTSTWSNNKWSSIKLVLNRPIQIGEGVLITPEKNQYVSSSIPLELIFGKEDSYYHRINASGEEQPTQVRINRVSENIGRFAYESDTLEISLTGSSDQEAYVVGNPFICHLDVDAFKALNTNVVSVKAVELEDNPNADYTQSVELSNGAKIAPMQSFFVQTTPTTSLSLKFTSDMMVAGDYGVSEQAAPQTRAASSTGEGINLANIKAYAKNGEAVISASEAIQTVQVVTANGQMVAAEQPNATNCRVALASGVNIVKVQTENGEKVFKLVNKQ